MSQKMIIWEYVDNWRRNMLHAIETTPTYKNLEKTCADLIEEGYRIDNIVCLERNKAPNGHTETLTKAMIFYSEPPKTFLKV